MQVSRRSEYVNELHIPSTFTTIWKPSFVDFVWGCRVYALHVSSSNTLSKTQDNTPMLIPAHALAAYPFDVIHLVQLRLLQSIPFALHLTTRV